MLGNISIFLIDIFYRLSVSTTTDLEDMIQLLLKENRRLRECVEDSNVCISEVNLQVCGVGREYILLSLCGRGVTHPCIVTHNSTLLWSLVKGYIIAAIVSGEIFYLVMCYVYNCTIWVGTNILSLSQPFFGK